MASDSGPRTEIWNGLLNGVAMNGGRNWPKVDEDPGFPDGQSDLLHASTDLDEFTRSRAQFLRPNGLDSVDAPPKRGISWPAVPRIQALSPLQKRIESFQRRIDKLKATRTQALAMRVHLQFLRNNYRQQHKFVDESQRKVNDLIDTMMQNRDLSTWSDEYLMSYARARDDYFRLIEKSSELQTYEDELTNLETSLFNQEEDLRQYSDKILRLLRHMDPATRDEGEERDILGHAGAPSEQFSSDEDRDDASAPSTIEDPILYDYFDKAGNVKVAKSRLIELLKEHENKRVDRNFERDQGNKPSLPEPEFEETCQVEQSAAERAIEEAIVLRDEARALCLVHNIDPDEHRHTSEVHDDHRHASGLLDAAIDGSDTMEPSLPEQPPPIRLKFSQNVDPEPVAILTTTGPSGETVVLKNNGRGVVPVADKIERWFETTAPAQVTSINSLNPIDPLASTPLPPPTEVTSPVAAAVTPPIALPTPVDMLIPTDMPAPVTPMFQAQDQTMPEENTPRAGTPSRADRLSQELEQYFANREEAEFVAQLVIRSLEPPTTKKVEVDKSVLSPSSSVIWNHARSSSESRLAALVSPNKSKAYIEYLRRELRQYLIKHGGSEVIERLSSLGIELPPTAKESMDQLAREARTSLSDHSRSSSESRISIILRTDRMRSELAAAGMSERPRGRRP